MTERDRPAVSAGPRVAHAPLSSSMVPPPDVAAGHPHGIGGPLGKVQQGGASGHRHTTPLIVSRRVRIFQCVCSCAPSSLEPGFFLLRETPPSQLVGTSVGARRRMTTVWEPDLDELLAIVAETEGRASEEAEDASNKGAKRKRALCTKPSTQGKVSVAVQGVRKALVRTGSGAIHARWVSNLRARS